jgi:dTDP-4-dehydrorhamnose reductase
LKAKILLLGAKGQLGWELSRSLAPLGDLIMVDRTRCDLSDQSSVDDLLNHSQATIIVNAAAYTAVDKAETDRHAAFALNAHLPEQLAKFARASNAWLIHFSTDYVFDGAAADAYVEDAECFPQTVYGQSKLAGEQAVLRNAPSACVFRLSWVFGRHGGNFVKTILRLTRERHSLQIVADQRGRPTPAALAADVTALAVHRYLSNGGLQNLGGIYHMAATGACTWYEYAKAIIETAHALHLEGLRASSSDIVPIVASQFPTAAKRPANSELDCKKLEAFLNISMPHWKPYLTRMLETMN